MKHFLRTASRVNNVLTARHIARRTFAMSSIRAQTAHLLLDRISPDEQTRLVRDVAKSLDSRSGKSDLSFAATLLQLRPDEEASSTVFQHLQDLIERGELDQVASVCFEHPEVGDQVLSRAALSIQEAANLLSNESKEYFAVPVTGSGAKTQREALEANKIAQIVQRCTHSLRLVKRVSSQGILADRIGALFQPTLVLLGAANHELRSQASETLFLLFSGQEKQSSDEQQRIWTRVQDLTQCPDKFYKALGYSLWLRWISSSAGIEPMILKSHDYWSAIINGLRFGDSERCKSSLQILRASVTAAVHNPELLDTIVASSHTKECKLPNPQVRHWAYTCKFAMYLGMLDMFISTGESPYT